MQSTAGGGGGGLEGADWCTERNTLVKYFLCFFFYIIINRVCIIQTLFDLGCNSVGNNLSKPFRRGSFLQIL